MIPASAPLVWVTRTAPDNERTAAAVVGMGYRAICVPVLEVEPLVAKDTGSQPDAIVFTSPNGVRFHTRDNAARHVPVFAVGDRTADVARETGYSRVTSADGDVNDLEVLIARTVCRGSEVRCYGPEIPAGDLVGDLRRNGFRVAAVPVYRTVRRSIATIHEDLPLAASIGMTLVHSPRAGRIVRQCIDEARFHLQGSVHCISAAAAAPFADLTNLKIVVAARPNEKALLATLPELSPSSAS